MKSEIHFTNGLTLRLDLEAGEFKGIGEVAYRGELLRSGQLPWTLYTESESEEAGFRFERFRLCEIREQGASVELHLESVGEPMPRVQAIDAMGEARIKPRRLKRPVSRWIWRFEPIRETLWDQAWEGLAMQVSFESPEAPIHWVMEEATWELGGTATGTTLIQQDVSGMEAEKVVRCGDGFSTIEQFFNVGWGGSYPMDMLPRGAGASICDFQAKGPLALTLFAEQPGLTRARCEKLQDEDLVHYLDRAYFPLATSGAAPVRKLLVHRADTPQERHTVRNLWLDCFTEVRRRIHATYGFQLEIPVPATGGHLWDEDLKRWGPAWVSRMEEDFPEYERLGYRQSYFHGVWEGITTDPHPPEAGNICCPYTFRYSDSLGGPETIRRAVATAARHGIRLMQWVSFHLSRHAPVWKEHPDWMLKKSCGNAWNGNYRVLASGRMRSPFRDWMEEQLLALRQETGLDGLFWDSYQNLGVTGIDWGAPDKAPQAEEIFRLQARLQAAGFLQRCEIITIFGVSAVGFFGFDGESAMRRRWVDFLEGDHAFALLDTSPSFHVSGGAKKVLEVLTPERYFWLLAHRVVPMIGADPWAARPNTPRLPGGGQAEAYARINHCYNRALPRMERLRLQPGGTHVVWHDAQGRPAVLWAFAEAALPPLADGACWRAQEGGEIATIAAPQQVYEADGPGVETV